MFRQSWCTNPRGSGRSRQKRRRPGGRGGALACKTIPWRRLRRAGGSDLQESTRYKRNTASVALLGKSQVDNATDRIAHLHSASYLLPRLDLRTCRLCQPHQKTCHAQVVFPSWRGPRGARNISAAIPGPRPGSPAQPSSSQCHYPQRARPFRGRCAYAAKTRASSRSLAQNMGKWPYNDGEKQQKLKIQKKKKCPRGWTFGQVLGPARGPGMDGRRESFHK